MRFGTVAIVLLCAAAAAGCLGAPAGTTSETDTQTEPSGRTLDSPGADTFWMVWVHGGETREQTSGDMGPVAMCSILFDHHLDPEERQLTAASQYGLNDRDITSIIAFDHFERWGSCPITYTLRVNEADITQDMGRYGTLAIEVQPDGALLVNGTEHVALGDRLNVTYTREMTDGDSTYDVHGQFYVENLGAWSPESLRSG